MSYPKKIPPPGRRHVVDPLDRRFPMAAALHSQAAKIAPLQKRWALPRAWQLDQGQTPQCFPPETLVLMADGSERPIREVRVGESVITHTGASRMVTAVMGRNYKGPLVALEVRGLSERLRSTPEHPYFATYYAAGTDKPDRSLKPKGEPEWIAAGELQPITDRGSPRHLVHLARGRVAVTIRDGDTLDLADYLPADARITDLTVRVFGARMTKVLPRFVPASLDLARLIGLYLAEGYSRAGGDFCISLGGHERDLAEATALTIYGIFGVKARVILRGDNLCQVYASHSTLGRLFDAWCGRGCSEKRLHPSLFSWDDALLEQVWEGFAEGDGYERTNEIAVGVAVRTDLVTVSRQLARDLFRIGLRLGFRPTLRASQPKISHGVRSRKQRWDVCTYRTEAYSNPHRYETDLAVLTPVRSAVVEEYDGKVYNIEVEEDHSYVAGFAVVHNCVAYTGKHWELSQPVSSHKGDSGLYPGDLYLRCKAIDGYPNEDGTDARTLLKVYQAMGKVGSYHWYDGSLEDVRLWLLTMGSCFLGAFWTESMFEPDINGMLTVAGDFQYGHEVLLIGYNRSYKLFEVANSWGVTWGVKGRAFLKEADLQRLLDANGDCVGAVEVRKPT